MTYAEELKQEGKREGKQEGMQLGVQLGHQEAQQEIAQQLLKSGVDTTIIANATHLTPAQVEELKKSLH